MFRIYFPINSQLAITDIDTLQIETWTILTTPINGALSGFPATAFSLGRSSLTMPSSVYYTPYGIYTGADSFQVIVSDGTLSDTLTMYVNVDTPSLGSIIPVTISGSNNVCVDASIIYTETVPGGVLSSVNQNVIVGASGNVVGAMQGVDTIIYAVTNGCTATTSKVITINPKPYVGIINGSNTLCVGATTLLTDSVSGGAWSTTFSLGGTVASVNVTTGIVSGLSSGISTIVYTVNNAWCTSLATKVITIGAYAGTITGLDSVCEGSLIILSDNSSDGAWAAYNSNATISDSGILSGVLPGIDTITYTVSNSCGTASTEIEVNIYDCNTAVTNTIPSTPIKIFPNPASSVLNIEWTDLKDKDASIVITDVTGRVVLRSELVNNITGAIQLNISGLNDGVYILTISSESVHYTDKVVISKR